MKKIKEKIIVCQIGSRHRYIIPEILEKNNYLYRLYTDSTKFSLLGKVAGVLKYLGIENKILNRLYARFPKVDKKKLYSSDILFCKKKFWEFFEKDSLRLRRIHYKGLSDIYKLWGVHHATAVYGMFIENYDFLKYAKSKGLKIIVDIYENPWLFKEIIDEINTHPEYDIFKSQIYMYEYSMQVRQEYMEKVLAIADYVTVPSIFVRDSLIPYKNFDNKKIVLLQYGSSMSSNKYYNLPIRGRFIWVGNNPVIKGLVYIAKAADILKTKYPYIDFRIIGLDNSQLENSKSFKNLNFIGILDKNELIEEYKSAEAFVFPTLSEGLSGVVIEAASFGCPIITTVCSGLDKNSFPAVYIPTKNVEAIVDACENILNNHEYRNTLSLKVYEHAQHFTNLEYSKRLTQFIEGI